MRKFLSFTIVVLLKKGKSLLLCLCFALITIQVSANEDRIWGDLEKGRYGVGFRTIESYDLTRPPIREQLVLPIAQQKGRSVQINVWYPSRGTGETVSFRSYLELTAREIDYKRANISDQELIDAVAKEQSDSHGISINKEALRSFLQKDYKMEGLLNATPAEGKFPTIIVGSETAFKWCVLAEYLASHGYVVVASPNTGSSEKLPDFERTLFTQQSFVRAQEASIDDLQHVMSVTKTFSFADTSLLGILGYSSGVTTGIGLITSGVSAKAIVSLEGAIGGYYGPKVLSETASYSAYLIRQPILHFFTPSFGYDHFWLDNEYKYADRTIIAVYPVRHEDFTSYGALERFATGISGKPQMPPKLALETAALYTRNFFDAHLLENEEALRFLQNSLDENRVQGAFQEGVPDGWKGIKRLKGNPTFDEYELEAIHTKHGFTRINEIYQEYVNSNSQPFSVETFFNFGRFLVDVEDKESWFTLYVRSYPESCEAHFLLGQAKEKRGKTSEAVEYYKKTLALFSISDNILLKKIFTNIINKKLEALSGDQPGKN